MCSTWTNKEEGQNFSANVLSFHFLEGCFTAHCEDVLRLVEREDWHPMVYVYQVMMKAQKQINESLKMMKAQEVVDQRWCDHGVHLLQLDGYLLNPSISYSESEMMKKSC